MTEKTGDPGVTDSAHRDVEALVERVTQHRGRERGGGAAGEVRLPV